MAVSRNIFRDKSGASIVEFGLLAVPIVIIILGIIQFYALHVMENTLSDGLYESASKPESELLLGQKDAYKKILCDKTAFPETCSKTLVLELQRLEDVSVVRSDITEKFALGSSNDVLSLRASTSVVQFAPFIPVLKAKASVVFRRPA